MTAELLVTLLVWPEQSGLRLDQFLAAATGLSRRHLRERVAGGAVRRNGRTVRTQGRRVETGDVVEVALAESPLRAPAELSPLTVLHADPWLVAVDKPAGVLAQPAERRRAGELALDEHLLLQLAHQRGRRPFLRLVHRLDRGTSGVTLFAASPEATRPLDRLWRRGEVERVYLARVAGRPAFDRREVTAPLARAPGGGWRFAVTERGRPAVTQVEVAQRRDGEALVRCRLLTGRTHQVRVHLAHLGHPVLGDPNYGGPGSGRLWLHAHTLTLPHPAGQGPVRIVASPPPELTATG